MPKFHWDIDQYSDAWWALRSGKPTASQFERIITQEGEASAQARSYMYELIAERLLNEPVKKDELSKQYWPKRGSKLEDDAIERFVTEYKLPVRRVGFVETDDGRLGCSPDCLVGDGVKIGIGIKCPAPWTHIGYLLDGPDAGKSRKSYKQQVQGQMLIGEWELMYFVSYHPQMPLYVLQTTRNRIYIDKMARVLDSFCKTLDALTEIARSKGAYLLREDVA